MRYLIDNHLRKKYKITNKQISEWFNYSSPKSFDASSSKNRILKGIDTLLLYVEERIKNQEDTEN